MLNIHDDNGKQLVSDGRFSKHFSYNEMIKSDTADRLGIANTPNIEQVTNLSNLVNDVLEKVRGKFGRIEINSGFRGKELNAKIPGSSTKSQHCNGMAADFKLVADSLESKVKILMYINRYLPFDKMIAEYWHKDGGWIHLSFNPLNNRKQVYLKKFGVRGYKLTDAKTISNMYTVKNT